MSSHDLTERMLKEFGPLMGGEELRRTLGFRTEPAFARAVRMDAVGVRTFNIPNRRGKFAFTIDVAAWLAMLRQEHIGD